MAWRVIGDHLAAKLPERDLGAALGARKEISLDNE